MHLRRLLTDDGAVSPVIGVILMIAITVILAAVAGVFVLEIETGKQPAPTATFAADAGELTVNTNVAGENETVRTVALRHRGGDAIDPSRLSVVVDGQEVFGVDSSTSNDTARRLYDGNEDVTAGDEQLVVSKYDASAAGDADDVVGAEYTNDSGQFTVAGAGEVTELETGETVTIRWKGSESERSATLFEHEIGTA